MSRALFRVTTSLLLIALLFSASALANNDRVERGIAAYEAENYEQAFELLKPAADEGNAEAQYYVGRMYGYSRGVEQQPTRAMEYYRAAAQQDHAQAQEVLAYAYLNEVVVDEDVKKAVSWYRKAAELGHASAQRSMGIRYREGEGVEQDFAKAAQWFRRAAEQGDARAARELGHLYFDGEGVDKDYASAAKWYQKALSGGDEVVEGRLSWLYESGRGVDQDLDRAYELRKKELARDPSPVGHFRMASILRARGEQQDSEEDLAAAIPHLTKAALGGVKIAAMQLYVAYRNGDGVKRDGRRSYAWLAFAERAGVRGVEDSLRELRARMSRDEREEAKARAAALVEQSDG